MVKTHHLKTAKPYYDLTVTGKKTHELRIADRDYEIGDTLHLYEIEPDETRTGRNCILIVTNILWLGAGSSQDSGCLHFCEDKQYMGLMDEIWADMSFLLMDCAFDQDYYGDSYDKTS